MITIFYFIYLFYFLATPHGMQILVPRAGIEPCSGTRGVLTTGPPGKSYISRSSVWFFLKSVSVHFIFLVPWSFLKCPFSFFKHVKCNFKLCVW